jgi:hypothetical protein
MKRRQSTMSIRRADMLALVLRSIGEGSNARIRMVRPGLVIHSA